MPSEPKIITATTFIDKVIEFILLEPNREKWSSDAIMNRESRQVRLQQLAVLIPLFIPQLAEKRDIRTQIEMTLSGEFVLLRESSLFDEFSWYEDVLTMMRATIEATGEWDSANLNFKELNIQHIKRAVNSFFDFKCMIQQLRWFNSGILEMNYGYYYAVMLTDNIANSISTDTIDHFLSKVIDPKGQSFLLQDLRHNNGYPREDVYHLEMEEW